MLRLCCQSQLLCFAELGLQIGEPACRYASALGDGARVELDLCSACVKEVLGPWLRVSDGPLRQRLKAFDPGRHGGEFAAKAPIAASAASAATHAPEEALVARLRGDPDYAAGYLNQVMLRGDANEIQVAVRSATIAGVLDTAAADALLTDLAAQAGARRGGGLSVQASVDELKAKLAAAERLRTQPRQAKRRP